MTQPIEVDLPHSLGKEAAKRKIDGGFGKIAGYIPGGSVTEHQWSGDTLNFTVEGMGQRVAVKLDVAESNVHATFVLPAFLALFSEQIRARLQKDGPKLLE